MPCEETYNDEGFVAVLMRVVQIHSKDARYDTHERHAQGEGSQKQLQL